MTREEFDTLCRDDVRRAVEENLGRDPLAVALDRRTPHAALVATQVKYLERARTKLPSYYAARCILPPRAFEQASSEACAAHKEPAGDAALDLTCGLGVGPPLPARRGARTRSRAGGRRGPQPAAAGRRERGGGLRFGRGVPRRDDRAVRLGGGRPRPPQPDGA